MTWPCLDQTNPTVILMPDQPESNRRDFLKGQSALNAIRNQVASGDIELPVGTTPQNALDRQSNYLEQYSKNAMACEFEFLFNMHQYRQSGGAAMKAFQLIDQLEDQMTVYRDHSEISQLNQAAYEAEVIVEQKLFGLLELAQKINENTGQAFDVTSSALTNIWGFDRRQGELPDQEAIDEALQTVGAELLQLNCEKHSVRFKKKGVKINLGGIGKGHALDRVADLFESMSIHDFIIHGGQSSVIASGSSANNTSNNSTGDNTQSGAPGWVVGISHPTLPGVRLGEVTLKNQSLGTSGTGRQGFYHNGKRYGHIIDPRTGWPTSHFLSSTVITNSAALSDALATAFFVMSPDDVAAYCQQFPEVSAILVRDGSTGKSKLGIDCFNIENLDWRRLT